ncbi:hypothetical protein L3V31_15715 [Vibrio sp. J1-1]|uniref:hypothetical protein n=1 Tax=Vibrio sp. J1-1 TaxID=2912251 RepID=UPI001F2AAE22|nr:hypothetical protein [Vibrio sp. J1-1]MBR9875581.1 hypothetical protein [Vibrionaceae bacterium]MCF7483160.1 hypothetical protein [Vibrio sp. J1-1]
MYTQIDSSKKCSTVQLAAILGQRKKNLSQRAGLEDNRRKDTSKQRLQDGTQSRHQLQRLKLVSSGVIQSKGINFDAGQGSLWHVHKDHVKYNGDDSSRVNFTGRSKTLIKKNMEIYHNTLSHSQNRHHTYLECRKWINKHL